MPERRGRHAIYASSCLHQMRSHYGTLPRGIGMSLRILSCALLTMAVWARTISAAVVDATWQLDANGVWGTASNWDVGVVPNNGGDQYNVRIDNDTNFNVNVFLNANATIGNLVVDANDALRIADSATLFVTGGTITNNGYVATESTGS